MAKAKWKAEQAVHPWLTKKQAKQIVLDHNRKKKAKKAR
jgi:hypothetical protein